MCPEKIKQLIQLPWSPSLYSAEDIVFLVETDMINAQNIVRDINGPAPWDRVTHHDLKDYLSDTPRGGILRVPSPTELSRGEQWLIDQGWQYLPQFARYRWQSPQGRRHRVHHALDIALREPPKEDKATPPRPNVTKDYYSILGVSTNATLEQIQKAFRQRAREVHPDRLVGKPQREIEAATAHFTALIEARDTLTTNRNAYDRARSRSTEFEDIIT